MKTVVDYITSIPDFPKPGILFRDITSVLQSAEGLRLSIDGMADLLQGVEFDTLAGTESRGFLFGAPLAYRLGKGFVLVRKKGKLPRKTIFEEYNLEYGTAAIEMHTDAIRPGDRVVLVDDLLATGGTMEAAAKLVENLGGTVAKMLFLIELEGLGGRERLAKYSVGSLARLADHE